MDAERLLLEPGAKERAVLAREWGAGSNGARRSAGPVRPDQLSTLTTRAYQAEAGRHQPKFVAKAVGGVFRRA
jgi:hypothetical protein